MLWFIVLELIVRRRRYAFQNILCYGLSNSHNKRRHIENISKHLMLWFIDLVVLGECGIDIFQNILCYGLSIDNTGDVVYMVIFQNILCYGLSLCTGL